MGADGLLFLKFGGRVGCGACVWVCFLNFL